jgi:DNA-binding CsgD family transcriptional regulator
VVDARVVELLVEQRICQTESPLSHLAPHGLEVLKEMTEGKTNAAIGESLHLSESAIEKYANAIFTKLGLSEEHQARAVRGTQDQPPGRRRPGLPARPRTADLSKVGRAPIRSVAASIFAAASK